MPACRCSPLRRRIKVHPLPRAGEHRGRVAVTVGLLSVKMRVNLGFAAACVGDLGDDFRALSVRNGGVFAQGEQVACIRSVGRREADAGRMHIGKRHHKQPEAAKTVAPEITGGVGQPAVGIGFVNRQRRDDKAVFDCHAVVEGVRRKHRGVTRVHF